MEWPVELPGSDTPTELEQGRFGHANVSGSVRPGVTETDGLALHIVATPTHSAQAELHEEREM